MERIKKLLEAFRGLQARIRELKAAHRAVAAEIAVMPDGDDKEHSDEKAAKDAKKSEEAEIASKRLTAREDLAKLLVEARKAISVQTSLASDASTIDTLGFYAHEMSLPMGRLKSKMRRLLGREAPSHRRRRRARWARNRRRKVA